jgi:hypothetical protein
VSMTKRKGLNIQTNKQKKKAYLAFERGK